MEPWSWWLVFALLVGILEIFLPGLTVICLSIGAACAAVTAFSGGDWQIQLAVFSVASLVMFFFIRPLLMPLSRSSGEKSGTNVDALLGQRGFVVKEIPAKGGKGWVKVSGEEWAAASKDHKAIVKDSEVVIHQVQGNTLLVTPVVEE